MNENHISVKLSVIWRHWVGILCISYLTVSLLLGMFPLSVLSVILGLIENIPACIVAVLVICYVERWELEFDTETKTFCYKRMFHKPFTFAMSEISDVLVADISHFNLFLSKDRSPNQQRLILQITTRTEKIKLLLGKPTENGFVTVLNSHTNIIPLYNALEEYFNMEVT